MNRSRSSTKAPNGATPLTQPSKRSPTLSCMSWTFFSCTISRSASIATRSRGEARQLGGPLATGGRVHAVDRVDPPPRELARDGLVRRQHELLDHPVRERALGAHDALRPPAEIEDDLRLGQVEVERAACPADL